MSQYKFMLVVRKHFGLCVGYIGLNYGKAIEFQFLVFYVYIGLMPDAIGYNLFDRWIK